MRVSKGPRYYRSKKAWFANLNGERHPLIAGPKGATEAEAFRLYNDLIAASSTEVEGDRAKTWTVLNAYLAWASSRTEPAPLSTSSYDIAKNYVDSACEAFGEVPVKDLTPVMVQEWLQSKTKGWGPCPTPNAGNATGGAPGGGGWPSASSARRSAGRPARRGPVR